MKLQEKHFIWNRKNPAQLSQIKKLDVMIHAHAEADVSSNSAAVKTNFIWIYKNVSAIADAFFL